MKRKFNFDDVNLNNLNIKEICRFCLSNNGILLSFGFKKDDALHALTTQMKTIISIEMEENDGLPTLICHSCLFNLEKSLEFKSQCEEADTILRNYIDRKKIKEEPPECPVQMASKEVQTPDDDQECSIDGNMDMKVKYEIRENGEHTMDVDSRLPESVGEVTSDDSNNIETMKKESYANIETNVDSQIAGDQSENGIDQKTEVCVSEQENEIQTDDVKDESVTPATENVVEMEENLNDMDNNMFGSEPFSLDLCSVRLQSEGPDLEDTTLYPAAHYTDEEQWSDSISDLSDEIDSLEPAPRPVAVGTNNCTTCNKALGTAEQLARHSLIHKQEPPFPCDYCDSQFDEKTLLKAHWRTHAVHRPHMCLTCGEAYAERPQLVKHFAVHDLIKPYHCPCCGKAFAYRSDLRKHAVIHTGARPFKCPVCPKTFTRSTNLNKHARVHSNRRPYPCEHCDKMFSSRGDLVRHSVIHTGEKPYACLICSLAFNRKDKLSRHERVHMTDRPFVCSECPTSFHRKEELTKHIRFHHYKPDPEYYTHGYIQQIAFQ